MIRPCGSWFVLALHLELEQRQSGLFYAMACASPSQLVLCPCGLCFVLVLCPCGLGFALAACGLRSHFAISMCYPAAACSTSPRLVRCRRSLVFALTALGSGVCFALRSGYAATACFTLTPESSTPSMLVLRRCGSCFDAPYPAQLRETLLLRSCLWLWGCDIDVIHI